MTDIERIEQRLSAVERTVTGEIDIDAGQLQDVLELSGDVEAIEERLTTLEDRIATLEADVQSIGGYYSEVESVNEEVERHALSAIASADRLEDRVDSLEESVRELDPESERTQRAVEAALADIEPAAEATDSEDTAVEEEADPSLVDRFRTIDVIGTDAEGTEKKGNSNGTDADHRTNGDTARAADRTLTGDRIDELVSAEETNGTNDDGDWVERLRERLP